MARQVVSESTDSTELGAGPLEGQDQLRRIHDPVPIEVGEDVIRLVRQDRLENSVEVQQVDHAVGLVTAGPDLIRPCRASGARSEVVAVLARPAVRPDDREGGGGGRDDRVPATEDGQRGERTRGAGDGAAGAGGDGAEVVGGAGIRPVSVPETAVAAVPLSGEGVAATVGGESSTTGCGGSRRRRRRRPRPPPRRAGR